MHWGPGSSGHGDSEVPMALPTGNVQEAGEKRRAF